MIYMSVYTVHVCHLCKDKLFVHVSPARPGTYLYLYSVCQLLAALDLQAAAARWRHRQLHRHVTGTVRQQTHREVVVHRRRDATLRENVKCIYSACTYIITETILHNS